jgi:hypothetical protein
MKKYFDLSDNIIDKKLVEYIDGKQFANRKAVNS